MLVGQVQLGKATKHVDNSASRRELESLQKKVPDPVTNTVCIHHHFTLAIFVSRTKNWKSSCPRPGVKPQTPPNFRSLL